MRYPILSLTLLVLISASVAYAGPPAKVEICHIPPGNPGNAHTITISEKALDAHLTNHGDYLGPCCTDDDSCDSGNLCEVFSCEADGCNGAPVDCDDGNVCTLDGCFPSSGCSNPTDPDKEDQICDTLTDATCQNGVCVVAPPVVECPCAPGWDQSIADLLVAQLPPFGCQQGLGILLHSGNGPENISVGIFADSNGGGPHCEWFNSPTVDFGSLAVTGAEFDACIAALQPICDTLPVIP